MENKHLRQNGRWNPAKLEKLERDAEAALAAGKSIDDVELDDSIPDDPGLPEPADPAEGAD